LGFAFHRSIGHDGTPLGATAGASNNVQQRKSTPQHADGADARGD